MDVNAQKMELLKALREHGQMIGKSLQHFDAGGPVLGAPATTLGGPGSGVVNSAANPNTGIAGTITGALGLTNNFQAGAANLQAGTNGGQLNNAYNQAQNGLTQQQTLANETQPGATNALTSQQALLGALQNETNGQGPNPAQAALNQNTAANVANQAALAAGQRGASSNAGLIARQAAEAGAQAQQNSVGQAATLQAQQQLAAQQQLQAQQAQLVGQNVNAVQGVNNAAQNEQNILQGANTALNNANVGMQSNVNSTNAQTAAGNQGMLGSVFGGVANGASSIASSLGLAKGGVVPPKKYAAGGVTGAGPMLQAPGTTSGPQSAVGQWLSSSVSGGSGPNIAQSSGGSTQDFSDLQNGIAAALTPAAETVQTGTPDPFNSPGAPTVSHLSSAGTPGMHPTTGDFAKGGSVKNFKPGGKVPGKPKVNKDSYSNDTVPAMVSPGEIVLPLHVTKSADPVSAAAQFVAALMKKKGQMAGKAA